jgi:hypothetical protein
MLTTAILVAIGAYLARAYRRGESPWKMLFSPENILLPLVAVPVALALIYFHRPIAGWLVIAGYVVWAVARKSHR